MSGDMLPYSFDKVWFMDCFGHVLCYAPYHKTMARVPLQGSFVSGFVAGPCPFPNDFVPQWCNIFGDLVPMPPLKVCPQDNGLVAFHNQKTEEYLSINPSNNRTTFSGGVQEWERFCPLPCDMYEGLLVVTAFGMSKIFCENDNQEVSGFHFLSAGENKPFIASFDRRRISFLENRAAFVNIGRMEKGETATFSFTGAISGKDYAMRITRLEDLTP